MNSNRMRVYVNNSFHLRRKYVRVFVRGHHLFRDANSLFNVQRKMHEHLFAPNEALCDYYPSNIFATHWKKMLTDSLLFAACGCLLLRVLSFDFVNENACPFLCDNSYTLSS